MLFSSHIVLCLLQEKDTFSSRQAALRYIRAMFSSARCKPIDALNDLCQINVINSRLFPTK